MSVRLLNQEDLVASTGIVKYPNPFFDLSNNYVPKNIKTLFKYCKTFFYTSGFLRNVITKLTEYPITDILYSTNVSKEVRDKYTIAFSKKLKLKSFLIEIGLDFFTYGNCFISTYLRPKRFLRCPTCNELVPYDTVTKLGIKNFKLIGTCPICKASNVSFKIEDQYVKSIDNFKLIRWAPENIDIDFNPLTGASTYYYNIPTKIKSSIIKGDRELIKEIPAVFLEALQNKKTIRLDDNNLFHFKRPTLAEDDMGWGKPLILPALKEIYYLQTLKRGNEAIAQEHVVPKKSIYPANTVTLDPYTQMNLSKWRGQIEEQIKKWKTDPNHIGIFPIPIGYQELGGNARTLLLTPEMKFLEEDIINGLGVPLEFIKGGASWTGGSVSLRIVENSFLTYRELLLEFINYFLIDKMVSLLKYPPVEVKFQKFRMADDANSKQQMLEMAVREKISDATLLDEFGMQYDEERDAMKKTRISSFEERVEQMKAEAEAQGQAMVIQAKYQVRAKIVAGQEEIRMQTELFQEELAKENIGIEEDAMKLIEKFAMELMSMDAPNQTKRLEILSQKMPTTYTLVLKRMQTMLAQQQLDLEYYGQAQGQNTSTNLKPVEKEKTKGQTRGNP